MTKDDPTGPATTENSSSIRRRGSLSAQKPELLALAAHRGTFLSKESRLGKAEAKHVDLSGLGPRVGRAGRLKARMG